MPAPPVHGGQIFAPWEIKDLLADVRHFLRSARKPFPPSFRAFDTQIAPERWAIGQQRSGIPWYSGILLECACGAS